MLAMPRGMKSSTGSSDESPKYPKLSKFDDTLTYICHDILKIEEDSLIILVMQENLLLSFDDLLGKTEAQIEAFVYTPISAKAPQPLMMAYYSTFNWLREWNLQLMMLEDDGSQLTNYE